MIEWNEEFSTHNEEIDAHHKRIVGLANKFYDAIKNGAEEAAIFDILQSLTKYAEIHFKAEEKLFSQTSYPNAYGHRCRHQEFRVALQQLKDSVNQQEPLVGLDLMEFLMSWFTDHIKKVDMQYVPYLKEIPPDFSKSNNPAQ